MLAETDLPLCAGDDTIGDWVDVFHIRFAHMSRGCHPGLVDGGLSGLSCILHTSAPLSTPLFTFLILPLNPLKGTSLD